MLDKSWVLRPNRESLEEGGLDDPENRSKFLIEFANNLQKLVEKHSDVLEDYINTLNRTIQYEVDKFKSPSWYPLGDIIDEVEKEVLECGDGLYRYSRQYLPED